MGAFSKRKLSNAHLPEDERPQVELAQNQSITPDEQKVTALAVSAGFTASLGGLIFGYVSGEISGFFPMANYAERFGELSAAGTYEFSAARQGTIVGLVSIGALIGALVAGKMADLLGRRLAISLAAFFTCVGTVIEISSTTHWVQFAVGRLVTGLSIGALSVVVPMYQSECSPAPIRGVIVSSYQLFITFGIWLAEIVNFGTQAMDSSASWRIPNGLSFAWALVLGTLILFFPESPRWAYGHGRTTEARATIARLTGLPENSATVAQQIDDLQNKIDEESKLAHEFSISEIFTGPRMLHRTLLGIALGTGQQLVGVNYFFYFGTTVFKSTGLDNSYVTQLILGSVNVAATIVSLWVVRKYGRRPILMCGAASMMVCFLIYAFVGHFAVDIEHPENSHTAGSVLIVFSCLSIVAFAVSWGPVVWAVNSELYPLRYRSVCMGLATAANWFWNFMLSFFTRFITDEIDYLYGLVFAGCCGALVVIVFFFVIESKDRTLEEVDMMYIQHVNPITSAKWKHGDAHDKEAGHSTAVDASPSP
ncbi:General substrate transporter [Cordyceps militaris]|uniref:General substrate transporter n=1 Tax=Cordyceps militaris TaxID=73501 RepID=A0A2H4S830_CORMI|nr:General substrate transporter [Cordyceps militaris]